MFKKKYYDKYVEGKKCNQKVIPILKMNRTKSEFYGSIYTGKDKIYWLICPECKTIIGTK